MQADPGSPAGKHRRRAQVKRIYRLNSGTLKDAAPLRERCARNAYKSCPAAGGHAVNKTGRPEPKMPKASRRRNADNVIAKPAGNGP